MEVVHTAWSTTKEYKAAMLCTTAIGLVVNKAADRLGVPNGGYGYFGVCNDSVAMVQAGLGEKVTQYPCILAGAAKATISQAFEVRFLAASHWSTHACVSTGP
jgi:hypothetical protein